MCTTTFNTKILCIAHTFIYELRMFVTKIAIISLHSIIRFIFIMGAHYVLCEV
jgi:hypothetical protein